MSFKRVLGKCMDNRTLGLFSKVCVYIMPKTKRKNNMPTMDKMDIKPKVPTNDLDVLLQESRYLRGNYDPNTDNTDTNSTGNTDTSGGRRRRKASSKRHSRKGRKSQKRNKNRRRRSRRRR